MTSTGVQAAMSACEQVPVAAPRRKRRAATKKQTASAVPAEPETKQFHEVIVGGVTEISDGYLERWEPVEVEDRWGNITTYRQRLLDENGWPISRWVEVQRRTSDNRTVVRFPISKFQRMDLDEVWLDAENQPHWRIRTPRRRKPGKPIQWFRPVPKGEPGRDEFVANREDFLAGLKPGPKPQPPEPVPTPADQWFVIELPEVGKKNYHWNDKAAAEGEPVPDVRSNFPDGWCCRLVFPRPERLLGTVHPDKEWVYVQFPVHFWAVGSDGEGREAWSCLTDSVKGRGRRGYRVNCGMWVPCWLLKPVTAEEAQPIHARLVTEYTEALKTAGY